KTLDPARAYSSDEYSIICQIYEPPLQYHYLKRPYELTPLTATEMPKPHYFDENSTLLSSNPPAEDVHRVIYEIKITQGILYQNHPCFAQDGQAKYLYHNLTDEDVSEILEIRDFAQADTRELTSDDYIYQIYRIADPRNNCPIFPIMAKYILGLDTLSQSLKRSLEDERKKRKLKAGVTYNQEADEKDNPIQLNYIDFPFPGVVKKDDYSFQIILKKKYPQFLYWLSMPFFSPIPWEADRFYSQGPLIKKNINLQCFPVGTGPFRIDVFDPNLEIILKRNENFHKETYPLRGEKGDKEAGYLVDAGKPLPFLEKVVYKLEKESIPRWNKFLQGYYDSSGISSDSFDQAISITTDGLMQLTEQFKSKEIKLVTSTATTTFYFAFNMFDPVVGGYSPEKQNLRQAIAIALDMEERIEIFANGRGIPAQGPIPPGIFGYEKGIRSINPHAYTWDEDRNTPIRKQIAVAQRLLAKAGYENGIDPRTGKPLVIRFDNAWTGPEAHSQLKWLQKQFKKIGVSLEIGTTDYNRFQEKILSGNFQFFSWGWNADYPDPENFLFLLYGPNGKKQFGGENAANYDNPEFNQLFLKMESMENTPERLQIIRQMLDIARLDAPWVWGFHPLDFGLYHKWVFNAKPHTMANNIIKYLRIDPISRKEKRVAWNKPYYRPLGIFAGIICIASLPAFLAVRKRRKTSVV
ncbi:MAG: ABC transporter substrate-binding protein, partial [Deltaproteobacteria bacterium]|nr:ABC transporter substrate-binding protein [Deltaproteobacteria bacterium]